MARKVVWRANRAPTYQLGSRRLHGCRFGGGRGVLFARLHFNKNLVGGLHWQVMQYRYFFKTGFIGLALLSVMAICQPAYPQPSVRDAEIAQCLPGEVSTWGDGVDRPAASSPMVFVYSHASAPAWFDEAVVMAALQRAADKWSQCGVPARVVLRSPESDALQGRVAVRWSDADSAGNFGLTHFGQKTLTLGPAAFGLLNRVNPAHDGRETLQMVISHEMGHLFGLMSHSRRCVDVTSNYDNGKGDKCFARDMTQLRRYTEYRATLPTACDIQRCRVANGLRN